MNWGSLLISLSPVGRGFALADVDGQHGRLVLGEQHQARGINAVIHFNGEPILRVKRAFESCVVDAGLKDQVSPHWLRHTSATWLMEQNADPWDAAGFLGMSVITLVRHYGHHRPSFQDDVRNRFGSSKPGTIPGTNAPEKPRHLKVV